MSNLSRKDLVKKRPGRTTLSYTSGRGGRKGGRRQFTPGFVQPYRTGMTLYSSPRNIMPQEYDTRLKYIVQDNLTTVGAFQTSIKFRTDAYDVDPTLASTAMPGFAELAAIYSRFRTLKIGYKFTVMNAEAFSQTVIHGFSGASIATGALNISYAGNPLFWTSGVGPATGQNRGIFKRKVSVVEIAGTQQALVDDLYTGSTTSSTLATAGTNWCYIGNISPIAQTAAGMIVTVEIELTVRFYRPNTLAA